MFKLGNNASANDAIAQTAAISRSQAVIEFDPAGKAIAANQNFLNALGYSLPEIQGKHHGMFVADEFKRIGKGGRVVWIDPGLLQPGPRP